VGERKAKKNEDEGFSHSFFFFAFGLQTFAFFRKFDSRLGNNFPLPNGILTFPLLFSLFGMELIVKQFVVGSCLVFTNLFFLDPTSSGSYEE
jgi:hypothetical protein